MIEIDRLGSVEDMGYRLTVVAESTNGNIVEIGGGEGINTIKFLQIAGKREQTVVVVDPFEQIPGADETYFTPYTIENFLANIRSQPGNLDKDLLILQMPSQHDDVKEDLPFFKPIGFMFIDGLQDTESVLSDLRLAESLEAEVICVDDYNRLTRTSQVPLAVTKFLETTNYKFIDIGKREAYFVK